MRATLCVLLLLGFLPLARGAAPLPRVLDAERLELELKAEPAWQLPLDAALTGPPVWSGSEILLALESALEARSVESGATLWSLEQLGGGLVAGASVEQADAGRRAGVALGGAAPRFALVDLAEGRIVAESALPAAPTGAPVRVPADARAHDDAWLVPVEGGLVLALDGAGRIVTRHVLGEESPAAPAFLLGFAVAWRGDPASLVTLEGDRTGRRVRTTRPNAAAGGGRWLSAPGAPGELQAWRCRERRGSRLRCTRRWTQKLGGRVLGRPLVSEERIIAGSLDTYVYAFRPRNGHLLWRSSVGHRVGKAPLGWDDYLAVVGEGRAEIVFLDALDGRIVGRIEGGSASRGETATTRPGRAGDLLVAPILEAPGSGPTLKAWRISFEPPPEPAPVAPATPSETAPPEGETSDTKAPEEKSEDS